MNRKFGVNLVSTPALYLYTSEEAYRGLKNAYSYLKRKLEKTNYDYSLLLGLSNVDGKTVLKQFNSNNRVGRPPVSFISKDPSMPLKTTNYHYHILVCGTPLSTITDIVKDYFQKNVNKKIINGDLDYELYKSLDLKTIPFYNKKRSNASNKKLIPRSAIYNLNVNTKIGNHQKEDYIRIENYIYNQSSKTRRLESDTFRYSLFDCAEKLNKVAKRGNNYYYNYNNSNKK